MVPDHTDSDSAGTELAGSRPARMLLGSVVVSVITLIVFLPSLRNGFVNWDDDQNFLKNPHYRGLGPDNLRWMFTTFHYGPYQPLSWMTLGADYLAWGMEPRGYHLTSVVLHAIAAGLFAYVAMRLLQLRPDALST